MMPLISNCSMSVSSACFYVRTCRRVRNSKKIATIRDFHLPGSFLCMSTRLQCICDIMSHPRHTRIAKFKRLRNMVCIIAICQVMLQVCNYNPHTWDTCVILHIESYLAFLSFIYFFFKYFVLDIWSLFCLFPLLLEHNHLEYMATFIIYKLWIKIIHRNLNLSTRAGHTLCHHN